VRGSASGKKTGNGMKAAFLAAAVLATAGAVFYFSTTVQTDKASRPGSAERRSAEPRSAEPGSAERRSAGPNTLVSKTLSLPMFFEPNQGQTAPQVKFLARGAGYGLFLTADEAVLELQTSAISHQPSAVSSRHTASSVIRMHLDGANSSPSVSGASPLPGKSSYFIGNDPSKWHHDIPQFASVRYQAVYPGVDLVYYGNQGQLEYDFRVAPGAEPTQIAMSFEGASARIDSGDLILSTPNGDVRFNAPVMYQQDGNNRPPIAGSFRQLANNKIGFTIGDYDHSRELVIDPVLTYSSYLGGGEGAESLVKVAINPGDWIFVAGSTTSTDFPLPPNPPAPAPYQKTLPGAQNIFIAVINTSLQPPTYPQPSQQLVYATYLGGSGTDSLAGIAVDSSSNIYVAGSTTSPNFPTTSNGFNPGPVSVGTHGFLSAITLNVVNNTYTLTYSTYLAGNGADTVTGLAIDSSCSTAESEQASCNAYVTGVTTSTNGPGNGFPANANGYQTQSNSPGNLQFFASKIYPANSGSQSMLYSTYFGGGNFGSAADLAAGGGIAVDPSGSTVNMYITGATNMLPVEGADNEAPFPILNAQQSCLNDSGAITNCDPNDSDSGNTDAFVAKINPNEVSTASLIYSTYLGGTGNDAGTGIAVDTSSNVYVTGSTFSDNWVCLSCPASFQPNYGGGGDAFIAKIGNLTGSTYPLNYFTYLGGGGLDVGQDIKVDSVQVVRVVGSTSSLNFPITTDAFEPCLGQPGVQPPCPNSTAENAFVALISTTLAGQGAGDYSTYLGGSGPDQGTGIAIDPTFGAAYVAGTTQSPNFPLPPPSGLTPFQGTLAGTQNAFVSVIGASSVLSVTVPNTSPTPNPVAAGTQVQFTFDITNNGPDNANFVQFIASGLPTGNAVAKPATATVASSGSGASSCTGAQAESSTISCFIPTLPVTGVATVQVDVTPASPVVQTPITISGNASANGGAIGGAGVPQPAANVVDFNITASPASRTINAGDTATFQVVFTPTSTYGYNASITPSQTTSPSIVTATTPIFNPTPVTLSGNGSTSTTLNIATVPRPVNTGSLLRRGSFYAVWLPVGGLSLVGLGIGASRKRRRWLAGAVLGLIAGVILLHPGCGSSSTSAATPGGTAAGSYTITVTGSAGTGASHQYQVTLIVD
jgi:hypothetical protein